MTFLALITLDKPRLTKMWVLATWVLATELSVKFSAQLDGICAPIFEQYDQFLFLLAEDVDVFFIYRFLHNHGFLHSSLLSIHPFCPVMTNMTEILRYLCHALLIMFNDIFFYYR